MHLLRFEVTNFRSLREQTELSFVSTALKDAPQYRLPSRFAPHGVLPVVGIYGANASGKTNLLQALWTLRAHVMYSYSQAPDDEMPWTPWRMEVSPDAPPTRMVLDFEYDEHRYQLGLVHRDTGVVEEWLYRWETNRRQLVYHRGQPEKPQWQFGAALTGPKAQLAEQTRPNALFLSLAKQLNHPMLTGIATAIRSGVRSEGAIALSGYPVFAASAPILQPQHRNTVVQMLRAADFGCVDFAAEEIEADLPAQFFEVLKPEAAETLRASMRTEQRMNRVLLKHAGANGSDAWQAPPEMESRGTQVFLQRINDILSHEHGVLIIDELDTSLHPDLCAMLVRMYASASTNPDGRQLLFTTHDRGLLAELRRDEVVLVDKGRDGGTRVRAASDFDGIRGRDDLRALHEAGRLGGVPVLGDMGSPWGEPDPRGPDVQ